MEQIEKSREKLVSKYVCTYVHTCVNQVKQRIVNFTYFIVYLHTMYVCIEITVCTYVLRLLYVRMY